MKKIVKLTEGDLNRLVKKVIKEDNMERPPRPLIKQERNPIDLGLFEKFFMGTRNANDKQFVNDYIEALSRELQYARGLEGKLRDGQSNISGVAPPRPRVKQEKNPNMGYNDHGLNEGDDMFFDDEMSGTRRRSEFTPTSREEDIQGVFGSYRDDIPPAVIRYMRKNPDKIISRLFDIYGDKLLDYLPQGPIDEAEEEMVKKTTYSKSEIDQAKSKGVGIAADGTVTPNEDGGLTVTTKQ